MKKLGIIGGASALLILGILLGAFFAGPLLASASSTGQQTTTTTAATPGADTANQYCTLYMNSLAKRLNISSATLKKAQQGALDDVLAQLVKDGKLTQTQADKIKTQIANAVQCNLKGLDSGIGKGPGQNFNPQNLQKYMTIIANDVSTGLHLSTT